MKNQDFNFIKDKFDSAQPELPESLSRDRLRQRILAGAEPKVVPFPQRKKHRVAILAAVACFMLLCGTVVAAGSGDLFSRERVVDFADYNEVYAVTATLQPATGGESGCEEAGAVFHRAEAGVEQPAQIKIADGHLYYAYTNSNSMKNRNQIYIFEVRGRETKLLYRMVGTVPDDAELEGVFVWGDRLTVCATTDSTTYIQVYNVENKKQPVLLGKWTQSGRYATANAVGDTLYVTSDYTFAPKDQTAIPYIADGTQALRAQAKDIVGFQNVQQSRYAVIGTLCLSELQPTVQVQAVLGGFAKVTCTKKAMFIGAYADGGTTDVQSAVKLDLQRGKFTFATKKERQTYLAAPFRLEKSATAQTVYPVGDRWLSVEENLNDGQNCLVLYDGSGKALDSVKLEKATVLSDLAVNTTGEAFALPACFAENAQRSYGVITFTVQDDHIVLTHPYKNTDDRLMYQGKCAWYAGNVYSVNVNDTVSEDEKLQVFSYAYTD